MKKIFIITAIVLVVACLVGVLAACGGSKTQETTAATTAPAATEEAAVTLPDLSGKTHAEVSEILYDYVLGDFYNYYQKANEASSLAERYALMAIAEAKLLEAGIMLPSTANGGNYAISRVVPYTVTPCLWGND